MTSSSAAGACSTAWETVRVLGGVLVREAKARDAGKGVALESAIATGPSEAAPVRTLLGELFPCP